MTYSDIHCASKKKKSEPCEYLHSLLTLIKEVLTYSQDRSDWHIFSASKWVFHLELFKHW